MCEMALGEPETLCGLDSAGQMSSASLQFLQSSILGIPHDDRQLQSCHVRSVPRRLPITSTSEVAVCILPHA